MSMKLSIDKCWTDHKIYKKEQGGATMGFKCLLFLVFLFVLPVASWAACTGSSPTWTSTGDYASVNSCLSSASAGDTINVSGNATWTSTLTISKSINLIGISSPVITRGSGLSNFITINLSSDVPVRVSGFTFSQLSSTMGTSGDDTIDVNSSSSGGSSRIKQLRIDHNNFMYGYQAIYINNGAYGVIDHNSFSNCYFALRDSGAEYLEWIDPIVAGTANALFFEDNTVTGDNNAPTNDHLQVYIWSGARVVIRYNTFDFTARTNFNPSVYMIDWHGNQGYFDTTSGVCSPQTAYSRSWSSYSGYYCGGGPWRGSPIIEIYNNTFKAYNAQWGEIRSGSVLAHDNTFVYTNKQDNAPFELWEEEGWQQCGSWFNPCRTVWPAQDQIMNSFFWNNILNGSAITNVSFSVNSSADQIFIQQNRDYFMHAPQSSGGSESWSGRLGGSQSAPTQGDTGNMTFSSSGANAYYPYTPYTYPHPLTKGLPAVAPSPPVLL